VIPWFGCVRSVAPDMLWPSHRARAEIMALSDTRAVEAGDRAMMPASRPL
jgi:hypothetical protein